MEETLSLRANNQSGVVAYLCLYIKFNPRGLSVNDTTFTSSDSSM